MRKESKTKIIHFKRKAVISLIILLISGLLSSFVLAISAIHNAGIQQSSEISTMLDNYITYYDSVYNKMMGSGVGVGIQNLEKSTALTASVLKRTEDEWNSDGNGNKPRLYGDGCLFTYDGKKAAMPDGLPADMDTSAITPTEDHDFMIGYNPEKNTSGDSDIAHYKIYNIAYYRIKDDLYYMEWAPFEDSSGTIKGVDWDALIGSIMDTYRVSIIELAEDDEGGYFVVGGTGELDSFNDTAENQKKKKKEIETGLTGKNQLVRVDGSFYFIQAKTHLQETTPDVSEDNTASGIGMTAVALVPIDAVLANFVSSFLGYLLLLLIIGISFIVWLFLAYRALSMWSAEEIEVEKLRPSDMRKKVVIFILASTIIMGCCCAFSHALNNLFLESRYASTALKDISASIDASRKGSKSVWEECKKEYISEAEKIATILDEHPQLRNPEWLKA